MQLLGLIIITLTLIPDVCMNFFIGSIELKPHLASLILLFTAFRKPFRYFIILLFYYSFLITPFTGLGFVQIFFSYLCVFGIAYRLRSEIYTESYLVQAVWASLFGFLHQVFLCILDLKTWHSFLLIENILELVLQSIWMAIFAIPIFIALDDVYEIFKPYKVKQADVYDLRNRIF